MPDTADKPSYVPGIILLVLSIGLSFFLGICTAAANYKKRSAEELHALKVGAVQAGHAEWAVDEWGQTEFRWK